MSIFDRLKEETLSRLPNSLQRAAAGSTRSAVRVIWPRAYLWPPAATWLDPLRTGFSAVARVERSGPCDREDGIYIIIVESGRESFTVAIDIADSPQIDDALVNSVLVYFKMQYRKGGYAHPNVVPGGFVPGSQEIYGYLAFLRALRDRQMFRWDVCGRFGFDVATEVRRAGVTILEREAALLYPGSERIRYRRSLEEVAASKVALDLPGNGPICFRLLDYLAVGACIVAYPHHAELPYAMEDGIHLVYAREDLSDLADICLHFRDASAERERMMLSARSLFDRHLHFRQLSLFMLSEILRFAALRRRAEARLVR